MFLVFDSKLVFVLPVFSATLHSRYCSRMWFSSSVTTSIDSIARDNESVESACGMESRKEVPQVHVAASTKFELGIKQLIKKPMIETINNSMIADWEVNDLVLSSMAQVVCCSPVFYMHIYYHLFSQGGANFFYSSIAQNIYGVRSPPPPPAIVCQIVVVE